MRARKWLDDEDILNSLSQDNQDWIKLTSETPAMTFDALARLEARKWLKDIYWTPSACFWLIYGYLEYSKGTHRGQILPNIESAHVMIDTAEWVGYEQTALWHRRLAIVLRDETRQHPTLRNLSN